MSDNKYTYEEMEIARFTDLPTLAESFGHEVQARGRWHFLKDAQHIVIKNRSVNEEITIRKCKYSFSVWNFCFFCLNGFLCV